MVEEKSFNVGVMGWRGMGVRDVEEKGFGLGKGFFLLCISG